MYAEGRVKMIIDNKVIDNLRLSIKIEIDKQIQELNAKLQKEIEDLISEILKDIYGL
jgi:hypothetical protein